jgi:hypothetical protein
LHSGIGGFVVISLAGFPFFFGLVCWGIRHARRVLSRLDAATAAAPAL